MFSGKSEELMRRLRRSKIAGKEVIAFKPAIDDRYETEWITSHNGVKYPCMHVENFYWPSTLVEAGQNLDNPLVIGIDEVQFFSSAIIYEIVDYVDAGHRVIVAGLDMTYRREEFGIMPGLMAIADTVDKLSAVCHKCGEDAIYTQRLIDGKPAPFSGDTIVVGGLDSYEARCRKCFEQA
jgi:thymidine kinase